MPLRDPRRDGAAYVGLGAALHGSRRINEAHHVLAAGARLNPGALGMLRNLATVRTELEDWKGAAAAWRRALVVDPGSAEAYRAAASVLQKAGRPSEAITWLLTASRLDPLNWQGHYAAAHAQLHAAYRPRRQSSSSATTTAATATASTTATAAAGTKGELGDMNAKHASSALHSLKPLHRAPISLEMRSQQQAVPPWTRDSGRGLLGDEPRPFSVASLRERQAARVQLAATAGRHGTFRDHPRFHGTVQELFTTLQCRHDQHAATALHRTISSASRHRLAPPRLHHATACPPPTGRA